MSEQPFPQEGPRTSTGKDTDAERPEGQRPERQGQSGGQSEGQVSEVQRLDGADAETPISPDDSTAGYPDSESGAPDTRGSGPDAAPPEHRQDDENARGGHRHPGQGIERG